VALGTDICHIGGDAMNGKVTLTFSFWMCCIVALLCGCKEWDYAHERSKQLWASEEGFPDREIVFDFSQAASMGDGDFGFIRPDGSGLITRTVAADLYATLPVWSRDGKFIAFRSRDLGHDYYHSKLHARVVSAEGKTVGWCCDWPLGSGRIWFSDDNHLVLRLTYPDPDQQPDRIVLADFRNCEILSTLYEGSSWYDEMLADGTLSSQGWLAVSRGEGPNQMPVTADIVILEPGSESIRVVGHGVAPAWSPDGEWLAFTGRDGVYVVRKDGSELRRVVVINVPPEETEHYVWSDEVSAAAWSPDGKWLVYDRPDPGIPVIFKVNVETEEEIELFRGGQYPNWRWDLDNPND
jgi:WD40 repeat protein